MNKAWLFILLLVAVSCTRKPKEIIGENEYYVCSMDPQVMEKQPGPCPICKMPLSKVTIDKNHLQQIKLSSEQIRLGNIKTDTIREDSIWEEKTLTGVFTVNQNLLQQVSSRFNGRIDKLYYKIPGQEIKEGDVMYDVYSRDLMLAEEEYLFTLDKLKTLPNSGSNALLVESAKNKLLLWGLTDQQIQTLENEKRAKIVNPIYSKVSGTITEIPFKEGDYINEGSTIFKLADLSSLWVEAQVYSTELNMLQIGDHVRIVPEALPEEETEGEIEFSNPELQPESRINLVRVKVDNSRKQLRPGMMAFVVVKSKTRSAITMPVDAVLQNGKFAHVWIHNADSSFEARKVQIGTQTKSKIEIISGLQTGDAVVTSGAYLLYSDYVFKRGTYPLSEQPDNTMNNMKNMNMDEHKNN